MSRQAMMSRLFARRLYHITGLCRGSISSRFISGAVNFKISASNFFRNAHASCLLGRDAAQMTLTRESIEEFRAHDNAVAVIGLDDNNAYYLFLLLDSAPIISVNAHGILLLHLISSSLI